VRTCPTVDGSRARLHAAGWSVGEVGTAGGWFVSGTNGQNRLGARGRSQAEAWHRACEQAAAVAMLGSVKPGDQAEERADRDSPWGDADTLLGCLCLLAHGFRIGDNVSRQYLPSRRN